MATRAEFGRSLSQPEDIDGGSGAPWKQRIYASIYRLRYGWSFQSSFTFGESPIWLLGVLYHPDREGPAPHAGLEGVPKHVIDATEHFQSLSWMTYRTNFPPLYNGPTAFTTDCGWGCMIRSGQMLLATALHFHTGLKNWRLSSGDRDAEAMVKHKQILSCFLDSPDNPFSLHALMDYASKLGDHKPGDWFGPSQVAVLIKEALKGQLEKTQLSNTLSAYVAHDCTVYIGDIEKLFEDGKRSVLLLVPIRLGSDVFNRIYIPCVKSILTLEQCVGIIGGKPKHSVYFVGHQDDNLIHLDPHFSQPSSSPLSSVNLQSYHCLTIRKLPASKMDPSCTVGFYCKNIDEFHSLCSHAEPMLSPPQQLAMYPFFTFAKGCQDTVLDCTINMQFRTTRGGHPSSFDAQGSGEEEEEFIVVDCKVPPSDVSKPV
eukprot:Em0011g14a